MWRLLLSVSLLATMLWTSSSAEAAACSRARREALAVWQEPLARENFAWVVPPVLNPFTRIAVAMCPADQTLRVLGYEREQRSIEIA